MVAFTLLPSRVHDTQPLPRLAKQLLGKLLADKDYIGK
jgi:hypothetical protein